MNPELHLYRLWLAVGCIGCVILLYVCLMPSPPQPDISNFDKFEHVVAFAALAAWFGAIFPRLFIRVFIALVVLGAAIELLQGLTGYRSSDVFDIMADMVGVVVGLLLARVGVRRGLETIDRHVFPE